MTYFIRAWVLQGSVITVCSSPAPLRQNTYEGPCDFAVDAEIDGEFLYASDVMASVSLKGKKLGGLKFVSQEVLPGVEAPPPPTAESLRPTMMLTRRQVFIGMEKAGIITAPEAIAVATVGTVPAAIKAAIETLPQDDQTPAFITFGLFQTAYRLDPMVALFQATAGMDDDAMDAFFTTYAAI